MCWHKNNFNKYITCMSHDHDIDVSQVRFLTGGHRFMPQVYPKAAAWQRAAKDHYNTVLVHQALVASGWPESSIVVNALPLEETISRLHSDSCYMNLAI